MFDIVTVGHFSIDSIFLPNRHMPLVALGGSPTYVSLAARRLDARVAVISKVGADFPNAYLWLLKQENIELANAIKIENAFTTRFELKYNNNLSERTLLLKNQAPKIHIEDVPNSLKTKAIHIAPIAGEITYDVVEKLKKCADCMSLDPQGLVRHFDENGNATLGSLEDKRILGIVNLYKSSLAEIKAVTNQTDLDTAIKAIHNYGVKIVIVTLGMKGATLSVEGDVHSIPAYKPEKVTDPTGAGDAFIGGFLSEYVNDANYLRCACVGSAIASIIVESPGPIFSCDKAEIYQRARTLYEKEIKE